MKAAIGILAILLLHVPLCAAAVVPDQVEGAELDAALTALGRAPLQAGRYYTLVERIHADAAVGNEFRITIRTTPPYRMRIDADFFTTGGTAGRGGPLYCWVSPGDDGRGAIIRYHNGAPGPLRLGHSVTPDSAPAMPALLRVAWVVRRLARGGEPEADVFSPAVVADLVRDVPLADLRARAQVKRSLAAEGFPVGKGGHLVAGPVNPAAGPLITVYFDLAAGGARCTSLWSPFAERVSATADGAGMQMSRSDGFVDSETLSCTSLAVDDPAAAPLAGRFTLSAAEGAQVIDDDAAPAAPPAGSQP